ncbi:hypothetical protein AAE026_24235 [Bradyrhizobium sp. DN5]|uniref:hypothetical protein n=1 Tax=Bradyrhizobium sp. DN5 TaxID=3056950 RepID=UPI0035242C8B
MKTLRFGDNRSVEMIKLIELGGRHQRVGAAAREQQIRRDSLRGAGEHARGCGDAIICDDRFGKSLAALRAASMGKVGMAPIRLFVRTAVIESTFYPVKKRPRQPVFTLAGCWCDADEAVKLLMRHLRRSPCLGTTYRTRKGAFVRVLDEFCVNHGLVVVGQTVMTDVVLARKQRIVAADIEMRFRREIVFLVLSISRRIASTCVATWPLISFSATRLLVSGLF